METHTASTPIELEIPLDEIQGLIVRGYNLKYVRHFVMEIKDPSACKHALSALRDTDQDDIHITSAAPWPTKEVNGKQRRIKPPYALNLGLTWLGMLALDVAGLDGESFASFSAYKEGAAKRAFFVGDTDDSAPHHWKEGFAPEQMHLLFSLYASSEEELANRTDELKKLLADATVEHNRLDGCAMPGGKIHFGYRDGISQPNVAGFPAKRADGGQLAVPAWNFVLKDDDYQLQYDGQPILPPVTKPPSPLDSGGAAPYKLPVPRELGLWGSFAAFRVLEQDVVAFDQYLESKKEEIDPELLAAKFCGRWRSGTPLALAPEQDIALEDSQLNNFNYLRPKQGSESAKDDPNTVNDLLGTRCPIGSHMRRNNPRNSPVSSDVNLHRIIRRGMPYGPSYQKGTERDDVERGLLGLFICASLESQFEFLMHNWVNSSAFAPDINDTIDPILGANHSRTSKFILTSGADTTQSKEVTGFPRFIKTRGSAYVFFPSLSAIKYMAEN